MAMKKLRYSTRKKILFSFSDDIMYQSIDGISIDDYSYDQVCLNCTCWIINGLGGGGMICGCRKGFTNPDDACDSFRALNSMDDDYNSYLAKRQKMEIWRSTL